MIDKTLHLISNEWQYAIQINTLEQWRVVYNLLALLSELMTKPAASEETLEELAFLQTCVFQIYADLEVELRNKT